MPLDDVVVQIHASDLFSVVVDSSGVAWAAGWLGYGQDGARETELRQPQFRRIGRDNFCFWF